MRFKLDFNVFELMRFQKESDPIQNEIDEIRFNLIQFS